MKKYTVLLLYPDYQADAYGQETYLAHVNAGSPKLAARDAQLEADRGGGRPEDFQVLLVCAGHVLDVKP